MVFWRQIEEATEGIGGVIKIGPIDEKKLSAILSIMDVGLTGYNVELLGKSSALAAMCAHGLEIVSLGYDEEINYSGANRLLPEKCPFLSPSAVANKFLAELKCLINSI